MKKHWIAAAFLMAATVVPQARANETDQFTLPPGKEFADLGDYFSTYHYNALKKVCDETNAKITTAIKGRDRNYLERLHSAGYIAGEVASIYGIGVVEASSLEKALKSDEAKAKYPGKVVAYQPEKSVYSFAHLPIDPRNAFL